MRHMVLLILSAFIYSVVFAAEPSIVVRGEKKTITRSLQQMKKMPSAKKVSLAKDPMGKDQPRAYWAVPVSDLIKNFQVPKDGNLEFAALDGMAARVPSWKILNTNKAKAWLAFQPVKGGWPQTKSGESVGPFYLIWTEPEKSQVGPEEWPFQVQEIRIRPSTAGSYPKLVPPGKLRESHPVQKGFQVFLKQCVHCHTLNKQGPAELGPDLNWPLSPTEYWKISFLKKYIRDPKAIRYWPKSKMPGFDPSEIPDEELRELMSYLKHMSRHRNTQAQ